MAKKTGLGRGLGSLLGDVATEAVQKEDKGDIGAAELPDVVKLSKIVPDPEQPRRVFDETALKALSESIRRHGVLQPIAVRWSDTLGLYIIVAGERRWRAARLAGLEEVPVHPINTRADTAFELSLVENLLREDLNPVEEAQGYRTLTQKYHMSEQQVGEALGRDRSTILNAIRLLSLNPNVLKQLEGGALTRGHARALLGLPRELQAAAADRVISEGMSVRETERYVKRALIKDASDKEENRTLPKIDYAKTAEQRLSELTGRKCKISLNNKDKGWVSLRFDSMDDLTAVVEGIEGMTKTS